MNSSHRPSCTLYIGSPPWPNGIGWILYCIHCFTALTQLDGMGSILCTLHHHPDPGRLDGSHTMHTASPPSSPDPGGLGGSHTLCGLGGSHATHTASPPSSPDPGGLNRRTLVSVVSPITPNQAEPISFNGFIHQTPGLSTSCNGFRRVAGLLRQESRFQWKLDH